MLTIHPRAAFLALVSSVVLAGSAAAASGIPDYPFVHVTGSAFQAEMPDIGALDFEIVALDADPAAARAVLDARVAEVGALMRQLDLDPEDVVVREVRQTQRKEAGGGGAGTAPAAPVYELRCDVHVNVRNLANWPRLAAGLIGKPNLDGFASSFDLSTMDRVHDALVTQALQDARRQADVIAAASGRRLGAVMAATPDSLKNLTTAMGLERGDFRSERTAARGGAQDVDRDQLLLVQALRLRQSVDVIFRLDNPPARPRAR